MKRYFFVSLLIISALCLSGCKNGLLVIGNHSNMVAEKEKSFNNLDLMKKEGVDAEERIAKWSIPADQLTDAAWKQVAGFEKDCVSVDVNKTAGYDVVSTLLKGESTQFPLEVYTPDYLKELESQVTGSARSSYKKDVIAHFVCHLGDGVDFIAGYLWSRNRSAIVDGELDEKFYDLPVIVVATKKDVYFYQKAQNYLVTNEDEVGNTQFGCPISYEEGKITWVCNYHNEKAKLRYTYVFGLDGAKPVVQGTIR